MNREKNRQSCGLKDNGYMTRWLSIKTLVLITSFIIVAQILFFAFYSHRSNSDQFQINRNIVAREVISLIQTIENKTLDQQKNIVSALRIPGFEVSINHKAKFNTQFIDTALLDILYEISNQSPDITLSFYLDDNHWLNISAKIAPRFALLPLLFLMVEISLCLVILLSIWNINRYTTSLRDFTEAADRLGVDLKSDPLPVGGPAPIKGMAYAINKMQQRITDLLDNRTKMLAAISHDLRTPITRLKLRAYSLEDELVKNKFIHDLDQINAMLTTMLAYIRNEGVQEERQVFDLNDLLKNICQDFADMGQHIVYTAPPSSTPTPFKGGLISINRLMNNVLENAIHYGTQVQLKLIERESFYQILVEDEGPGIPQEKMNQVFLPFYRVDSARSRSKANMGLGLSIVKDIIHAHGGSIELKNLQPKGLQVMIHLPKKR